MAANPIRRELLAGIEASGGWDALWQRVAGGESQTSIAASLNVSQGFLSRVIHQDAERVRAFREAKRLWAITLVERTGELVNTVKENRDSIAKVREVAAHARWEASKWDRELFGEDRGDVNVNVVNIGDAHLDALRHRMVDASRPRADPLGKASVPLELPAPEEGTDGSDT